MLNENYVYYPEQLTGEELDTFLEQGWFRMGQSIFTTHFLALQEELFRVYWLRYNLPNLQNSKEATRIVNRNRIFETRIRPFELSGELEELYLQYKTHIDFETARSVHFWLFGDQQTNVFNTYLIEVKDNEQLIAAGIFDSGHESIAGILNFYHPDYRKYSLGKYLMLLKIEYAVRAGKKFYYPGYIVQNYPRFDYKLFADKNAAELYIPEQNSWISSHEFLGNKKNSQQMNDL
jgi:arginine-tRNA-protein transferase